MTPRTLVKVLKAQGLRVVTAESCTGGLVAAALTSVPGSSDVFERGFVTYSNEAKIELLGVAAAVLKKHGAVSKQCAIAMAKGALVHTKADLAVSVTGIAGPGGGTSAKPVGLVHLAAARKGKTPIHLQLNCGDVGRANVRKLSVDAALALLARIALGEQASRTRLKG